MTAPALTAGWLLDRAVGDPRRGHPVAAFGRLAATAEVRVHRPSRAVGAAWCATFVVVPAAAAHAVAQRFPRARGVLLAVLVWAALGGRSLGRVATEVDALLADGDLDGARAALPALVGRDVDTLDADGIARAVVESVAENTSDAVVGVLVWAALTGPAGVVAFRAANTLDAMVGHRTVRHERFGWASARLDDVLGLLPARLTALLAAACAPLVGGSPTAALRAARDDGPRHPSPNAGPVEAAFAGALGVRLGGPVAYGGRREDRPALGGGRPPRPADIARAVRLADAVAAAATVACARGARR